MSVYVSLSVFVSVCVSVSVFVCPLSSYPCSVAGYPEGLDIIHYLLPKHLSRDKSRQFELLWNKHVQIPMIQSLSKSDVRGSDIKYTVPFKKCMFWTGATASCKLCAAGQYTAGKGHFHSGRAIAIQDERASE